MSFQDWCTWAKGNNRSWERVAENAEAEAPYASDSAKSEFQGAVGEESPTKKRDYNQICWKHPLRGKPVDGSIPGYLTRCITYEALRSHSRDLLRAVGSDIPRRGHATQQVDPSLPTLGEWMHAGRYLSLADELWNSNALHLAYDAGEPEAKSVFATPQPGDNAPPSDHHTPAFCATIQSVAHTGRSEADCAVYRLALGQRASADHVLLYYTMDWDASECKYPVPPDAAFQPLFRPVDGDAPFGQTSPGPVDEDHADHAEPELVHPNYPMAPQQVWIRSLDSSN